MMSRESRRTLERRRTLRRAADRDSHTKLVSDFEDHLLDHEGWKSRFDRIESRLNMILGGIAVVGFVTPIIITLLNVQ